MKEDRPTATPPKRKQIKLEPGSEVTLEHQGPGSTRFVITTSAGDIFRTVLAAGQTASFTPAGAGAHLVAYGSDLDESIATRKH